MEIFYGSGNPSKIRNMRTLLEGLPIVLVTPADLGIAMPEVDECGDTPWENARIKALAYYNATHMPSMGLDSGLYIEGVDVQPGTYVRRVGGKTLSDGEFIDYYADIARRFGGRVKARFINGLCVAADETAVKCAGGPGISTDWFWIVSKPHPTRIEGFPMDSIAVDPISNRYWIEGDLENEKQSKGESLREGIRAFFTEILNGNYESQITEIER